MSSDDGRPKIVLEGPLLKRGFWNTQFKERYFVLYETGQLFYFHPEDDRLSKPSRGCVDLALPATKTSVKEGIEKDGRAVIELTVNVKGLLRTFVMAATEEVRIRWIDALAQVIQRFKTTCQLSIESGLSSGMQITQIRGTDVSDVRSNSTDVGTAHKYGEARILIEGTLMKRGHWNPHFKERYFILYEDGKLFYFRSEDGKWLKAALGCVDLGSRTCISTMREAKDRDGRDTIELSVSTSEASRVYVMAAATDAVLRRWIAHLAAVLRRCRTPDLRRPLRAASSRRWFARRRN